MHSWSRNLIFGVVMILRRLANLTLRILRTPRFVTLILSGILFLVIWSNVLIDGRKKNLVEFLKQDKKTYSQAHFRPVRKNPIVEQNNNKNGNDNCPIHQFKPNYLHMVSKNDTIPVTCKRLAPVPGSCDTAKNVFDIHESPNPATCSHQERFDFCRLERKEPNAWVVLCNSNTTEDCGSGLKLGLPSHESGELIWETYRSPSLLAEKLTSLIQGTDSLHESQHYGFAFLGCDRTEMSTHEINENRSYYYHYEHYQSEDAFAQQLLILPPVVKSSLKSKTDNNLPSSFHDINFNIILVDSISHQHLFRSLPKTVSVLEQIATSSAADVLNFELFQAIKSRTFETLQTIFSGYVNVTEQPFGRYDVPPKPLNLTPIYKPLQSRGYRTLWLEDLCYLWEWGISKDLRFLQLESSPEETWRRMWSVLDTNAVDSIDVTIAMCQVLNANDVRDHFRGPDAVCFNGRHQHEYLLEYLQLYQTQMAVQNQPFFSMTSTNVAHEPTGKRVQTLDKALADYLSFTPSLENTISIIFSDHGNSYGNYFKESKEALIELYHPFMFFIIPHSAGALLGKEMMDSIKLNTKRLVTSLDIHYTLLHIADINSKGRSKAPNQEFPVSEKGLFDPVNPERDCYSVPRLKPSVCICQRSSVELELSSFASLFGYFAVGVLNDEIQFIYRQSLGSSSPIAAFGNCQPLHLERVSDIRELAGPNDQKFFQMNIHVQQSQTFFVSITLKRNRDGKPKTFLDSYSRTTHYGVYSNCSDSGMELALCICNLSLPTNANHESHSLSHQTKNIPIIIKSLLSGSTFIKSLLPSFLNRVVTSFKQTPCFSIFAILHKDGEALFGVNECKGVYTLKMNVSGNTKFVYFYKQEEAIILPGGVAFFGLIISEHGVLWKDFVQTEFTLQNVN